MSITSPDFDEQMMRRAIRLAMNGRGAVEPNPMVGCVIVKDGRVIGEGFHANYGGPHAEPNALAACTESPAGATAYVTLEPCCHTNKQTPPCAPRLIEAKVARIVVGCLDPNPEVNGKGLAILSSAGIQIHGPVMEFSAKQLIAPFIAHTKHLKPYVTLKWAETADGKVAGPAGARLQISSPQSMHLVHQLRARSETIAVGIGTVLTDDPLLIARDENRSRQLARIVLDSHARTPLHSKLVQDIGGIWVDIFISTHDSKALERAVALARVKHVTITPSSSTEADEVPLQEVLAHAFTLTSTHLLIESGPTLARSFFKSGLVDRVWVFRSPLRVDDATAPSATVVPTDYRMSETMAVAGDTLTEYLNPAGSAYFAPEPSADFILAKARVASFTPPG